MHKQKFLLVSIIPQRLSDEEAFKDLRELKYLVDTYGGEVADWILQRREVHDKGSYIGEGKIQEAKTLIKEKKVDIVVLNAIVKPGQLYDMKKIFWKVKQQIEVWDRVDLILQIFSKNAQTAEARLQIELAAMRHMGPRIFGMGMELSRQTGGIGGRGIGETNTERMRRHWRVQMKKTRDKLENLARHREQQLARRRKMGLYTVSLVGYTNAGKTSLFNALTGKHKIVQNALFVTLDSATGKIVMPDGENNILISDTIGFIKNLPPELIEAFKSTLMESMSSDILLHVIDASDERVDEKITVVEGILNDLQMSNKPRIYVFNKIDSISGTNKEQLQLKYAQFSPQFISVVSGIGLPELITHIVDAFLSISTIINT